MRRRWRRLRWWRRRVPRGATTAGLERREVGTCGSCGGPIVYVPVKRCASCPCGDSVLTTRLFDAAMQTPAG